MDIRVAAPRLDAHPSSYPVRELVRALADEGVRPVRVSRRMGAALMRADVVPRRHADRLVVVPVMGPRFGVLHAAALHGSPAPFCWDVWEPEWPSWVSALRRFEPPLVVVTSVQSAEYLRGALDGTRVEWLPEATTVAAYNPGPALVDRPIDVLELGRRYDAWHSAVRPALAGTRGSSHLYEKRRGELVFPDERGLRDGLARSKVSVCFPSSITHPERAGSVRTMTHRYLESIASRCLVLGQAPPEVSMLLGFDPVLEVDMHDPWGQLSSVLGCIDSFQDGVDRARTSLLEVGDWRARVRELLALIRDR